MRKLTLRSIKWLIQIYPEANKEQLHSPLELKLTNNTKLERIIIFDNIVVKQNIQ